MNIRVGIEALNVYGGRAFIEVRDLFETRGLDMERFDNLMMHEKSVGLPCEDPVTHAVNAAKPIIDSLSEDQKQAIELVIVATESGVDFGKAMSTYVHDYLGLSRKCRSFEVKHACYGGTAALQMAVSFVASYQFLGVKALVIATDAARAAAKMTYAEPSQGVGAVAMLVGSNPEVLELDFGANGYYSHEVMDTCRPLPEIEIGDSDLSLLSYLDCLEQCYRNYSERVEGVDIQDTFDYFAFHTPFAGMVKGAHRMLMRKFKKVPPAVSDPDFSKRVGPSLSYCTRVGNVYSATIFLALAGLIDHGDFSEPRRVGLFSYGSGCASEFFSGVVGPQSQQTQARMNISATMDERCRLSIDRYDGVLEENLTWMFGVQDKEVDLAPIADVYRDYFEGRGLLVLNRVKSFHREYTWS